VARAQLALLSLKNPRRKKNQVWTFEERRKKIVIQLINLALGKYKKKKKK
jgi:hypothetical protein